MEELTFRLLWADVVVRIPREAAASLAYMVQQATQSVPLDARWRYSVIPENGGYLLVEEDAEIGRVRGATDVLDLVYMHVHERAFAEASARGWVRTHGGLARVRAGRILLTAPAGTGKTTLMTRLAFDGAAVEGDESVLIREGIALAFPRPFHLKPGITDHVPEMIPWLTKLPRLDEPRIWALDLAAVGLPWTIEPGPIDAVVVLGRADDGLTTLEPVSATEVMHEIVSEVFLHSESKATVVREVARLLRDGPCFRLRSADPSRAAAALQDLSL